MTISDERLRDILSYDQDRKPIERAPTYAERGAIDRELLALRAQVRRYEEALIECDENCNDGHVIVGIVARALFATRTPDAGRAEPTEDPLADSGIDFDAELSYLRGTGPEPGTSPERSEGAPPREPKAEAADLPRTDNISTGTTIAKPCPMCAHSHHGRDTCGESMTMGQSAEGVYGGTYIVTCPCVWMPGTSPREPAEPDERETKETTMTNPNPAPLHTCNNTATTSDGSIPVCKACFPDTHQWLSGYVAPFMPLQRPNVAQCSSLDALVAAAREVGRVEGHDRCVSLLRAASGIKGSWEWADWLAARRSGR